MNARTPLVDLVPRSARCYAGLFAGGVAVVGLLELGHALMPLVAGQTTDGRVAALDLDGEGSLAVWFSSYTLLAASAVSLLIYALSAPLATAAAKPSATRRGIWLWAACCWTAMSIDECSSLHEAFMHLMTRLTGERLSHDGSLWWVLAYGLVLSTTGLLLLRAMRRAPAACLAFCSVAVFYGIAVLAELGWLTAKDTFGVMLEEGCEMLGNLSLLTALALFARHAADEHRRSEPLVRAVRFPSPQGEPRLLPSPLAEKVPAGRMRGRGEQPDVVKHSR